MANRSKVVQIAHDVVHSHAGVTHGIDAAAVATMGIVWLNALPNIISTAASFLVVVSVSLNIAVSLNNWVEKRRLARGPRGAQGPIGPQGPKGESGDNKIVPVTVVVSAKKEPVS